MDISYYYREICKTPMLTTEEETRIFNVYYDKNSSDKEKEEAKTTIISANLRFAFKQARYYSKDCPGMLEELISAANEGLAVAFPKYKPSKKIKFLSYAGFWVDQSIKLQMARMRVVSLPIYKQQLQTKIEKLKQANPEASESEIKELIRSTGASEKHIEELTQYRYLTYYISDLEESFFTISPVEEEVDKKLDNDRVFSAVSDLPDPHRQIMARLYGFIDGEEQSIAQISRSLRMTKDKVSTLKDEALSMLRNKFITDAKEKESKPIA